MARMEELARGQKRAGKKGNAPAERRESRRLLRGNQEKARWSDCTPAVLGAFVDALAEMGGGVLLGKSRDGGVLVLTIYLDGNMSKEYIRPSDPLDAILLGWLESWRDWPDGHAQEALQGLKQAQGDTQLDLGL